MDGDDPVRFRKLYSILNDIDKGIFVECNEYEIKELLIRKALEEWVIDTPEARKNLQQYLASLEFKEDD